MCELIYQATETSGVMDTCKKLDELRIDKTCNEEHLLVAKVYAIYNFDGQAMAPAVIYPLCKYMQIYMQILMQ
jgi:hypothetical protein